MFKFFSFFLIVFLFNSLSFSQNSKISKAENFSLNNEFKEERKLLQKYIAKHKDKGYDNELNYKLSNCNFNLHDYDASLFWIDKFHENDTTYYSLKLKSQLVHLSGDYFTAIELYNMLLKYDVEHSFYENKINQCKWAISNIDSTKTKVYVSNLYGGDRNLGFTYFDNGIITSFCTDYNFVKTEYYNLRFVEMYDSISFNEIEVERLSSFKDNRYYQYMLTMSKDTNTILYSASENYGDKNNLDFYSVIFYKTFDNELQKWSDPLKLPFIVDSVDYAHPFIDTINNLLYYSSNDTSGFGGYDLYKVSFENGVWGNPENLGSSINTFQDEVFPSLMENDLYFASNGHLGYGGLDIFRVKGFLSSNTNTPVNIGKPINSSKDDFSLVFKSHTTGHFVTNNNDEYGMDNVCFFNSPPYKVLNLLVIDTKDSLGKENVYVKFSTISEFDTLFYISKITDSTGKTSIEIQGDELIFISFSEDTTNMNNLQENLYCKNILLNSDTINNTIVAYYNGIDKLEDELYYKLNNAEVYFSFNTFNIDNQYDLLLDSIANFINDSNDYTLLIEGYADSTGSEKNNLKVSSYRAIQGKNYFLNKGVSESNIEIVYYGESKFKGQGYSKDQLDLIKKELFYNRKIRIRILKKALE